MNVTHLRPDEKEILKFHKGAVSLQCNWKLSSLNVENNMDQTH